MTALPLFVSSLLNASDVELSVTKQFPMSHSLNWVKQKAQPENKEKWDGVLDEVVWGTPSAKQAVSRNWAIHLTDDEWQELVDQNPEEPKEDSTFDLWIPSDVEVVRGVVAISSHGTGGPMFKDPALRQIARDLNLGLFLFSGNPLKRGFWPRSLLFDQLEEFGAQCGHPELQNAPLFLYGHSNGTGFSAIFPAGASDRVWAWMSMRPGTTFQVYQPGAAQVPGLIIFGETDQFLAKPSVEENLSIVPMVRKKYNALWNTAVEPKKGHGPTPNTWPLVYSFLKHSFEARVPKDADPRKGVVVLNQLDSRSGLRGENWNPAMGGYQELEVAPAGEFQGDPSTASWLLNEDYAADWQTFQATGRM